MILFTFLMSFALSVSALNYYQPPSSCDTKTERIAVTNTWAEPDVAVITSTGLVHDHTVITISNTKFIPTTTVSTLVVTHLQQVPYETSVTTIWQTSIQPQTATSTHTDIITRTTKIHLTETEVNTMTLTKTLIKPTTTTLTKEHLVTTYVPQPKISTTTVTHWESSTTTKPITVTWNNFKTSTVRQTVHVTKGYAKPAHTYTTITVHETVTKCPRRTYH